MGRVGSASGRDAGHPRPAQSRVRDLDHRDRLFHLAQRRAGTDAALCGGAEGACRPDVLVWLARPAARRAGAGGALVRSAPLPHGRCGRSGQAQAPRAAPERRGGGGRAVDGRALRALALAGGAACGHHRGGGLHRLESRRCAPVGRRGGDPARQSRAGGGGGQSPLAQGAAWRAAASGDRGSARRARHGRCRPRCGGGLSPCRADGGDDEPRKPGRRFRDQCPRHAEPARGDPRDGASGAAPVRQHEQGLWRTRGSRDAAGRAPCAGRPGDPRPRDRRGAAARFLHALRLFEGRGRPVCDRLCQELRAAHGGPAHVLHLWAAPVRHRGSGLGRPFPDPGAEGRGDLGLRRRAAGARRAACERRGRRLPAADGGGERRACPLAGLQSGRRARECGEPAAGAGGDRAPDGRAGRGDRRGLAAGRPALVRGRHPALGAAIGWSPTVGWREGLAGLAAWLAEHRVGRVPAAEAEPPRARRSA